MIQRAVIGFICILVFLTAGLLLMNRGFTYGGILFFLLGIGLYVWGGWRLYVQDKTDARDDLKIRNKLIDSLKSYKTSASPAELAHVANAYAKLHEGLKHQTPWLHRAISELGIIAFLTMVITSASQFFSQDLRTRDADHHEKRLLFLKEQLAEAQSKLNNLADQSFKSVRISEEPDWGDAASIHRQTCALAASFFDVRESLGSPPSDADFINWATEGEQWYLMTHISNRHPDLLNFENGVKARWFQNILSDEDVAMIRASLIDYDALKSGSKTRSEVPSYICYLLHRNKRFRKPITEKNIDEAIQVKLADIAAAANQQPARLLARIQETSDRLMIAKERYSRNHQSGSL